MKKQIAAGLAVTITAASVATNLLFTPTELLHSTEYLRDHVEEYAAVEASDVIYEYTEEETLSVKDQIRAWVINMPTAFKALLLMPLWVAGAVPVAVFGSLGAVLAPFWSTIAAFLLQAGILVGLFCGVYKLLFPHKKLRELFKKKNIPWLVGGAAGITGLNLILGAVWPTWSIVRVALLVGAGFGILCLLLYRICGKEEAPEAGIVRTRLKMEYA